MPYDEHAALRYPEITEPRLYGKSTNTAWVLITHPGRAGLYHPDVLGFEVKPLSVGHMACHRQTSCLSIRPPAFPIALSTASLRHSASGNALSTASIRRVAGVCPRERCHSRAGSSSIDRVKSRGLVQLISISLTNASSMALPK